MPLYLLPLLSLTVSLIANMFGIEGGAISVPIFVYLLGLAPTDAAGVALSVMSVALTLGAVAYARQQRIDYALALFLLTATIPGGILGSWLGSRVSGGFLLGLIGVLLVLAGGRFLLQKYLKPRPPDTHAPLRRLTDRYGFTFEYRISRRLLSWPLLLMAGTAAGMSGAGVGILQVPIMILLMDIPPHVAIATSVLVLALFAIVTASAHIVFGRVLWLYVAWLVPGVIVGSQLGAFLSRKTHPDRLQRYLGGLLLVFGVLLLAARLG